jgi:hypothetical protein
MAYPCLMKQAKRFYLIQVYPVSGTRNQDHYVSAFTESDQIVLSIDLTNDYYKGWQWLSLRQLAAIRLYLQESGLFSVAYQFLASGDDPGTLFLITRYDRTIAQDLMPIPVTVTVDLTNNSQLNKLT